MQRIFKNKLFRIDYFVFKRHSLKRLSTDFIREHTI